MTSEPRISLPGNEVSLSRIVFGAWRLLGQETRPTPQETGRLISAAVEIGMTSFDHADIYGDHEVEAAFGEGLAAWGGARGSIEIVTKCGIVRQSPQRPDVGVKHYSMSAEYIASSVEQSLKNFGTDYIDLLLLHRPDPLMDADETAQGLEAVVKSGKVRAVGVSNFTPSQFDLLQSRLSLPLTTNQIEMSVLRTGPLTDGSLDHAQLHCRPPMIWSPLGGGALFTGQGEREMRLRSALEEVRATTGAPDIAAVALAWLLRHPSRPIPVVGSMKPARLAAMAKATDIDLGREQWFEILKSSEGRDVP